MSEKPSTGPQGRLDELVGAVPVERDEIGHWWHPDLPWYEIEVDTSATPYVNRWGFEDAYTSLEGDLTPDEADKYFEAGNADCRFWEPSKPEGDGWFLAAIYDTEDGPYAMWLRPNTRIKPPCGDSETSEPNEPRPAGSA